MNAATLYRLTLNLSLLALLIHHGCKYELLWMGSRFVSPHTFDWCVVLLNVTRYAFYDWLAINLSYRKLDQWHQLPRVAPFYGIYYFGMQTEVHKSIPLIDETSIIKSVLSTPLLEERDNNPFGLPNCKFKFR